MIVIEEIKDRAAKLLDEVRKNYGKGACNINIIRLYQDEKQTLGFCWIKNNFGIFNTIFFTLELPWRGNLSKVSRIPTGVYQAKKYFSPGFKRQVILLEDIPGRSLIEIHPLNYNRETMGCIGVAYDIMDINKDGIPDLRDSRDAMDTILKILPDKMTVSIENRFKEEK